MGRSGSDTLSPRSCQQSKPTNIIITEGGYLLYEDQVCALRNTSRNSGSSISTRGLGTTQLKPGSYKVEWQGSGPVVQVSFEQNGKTLVTVSATLKAAENQVTQD